MNNKLASCQHILKVSDLDEPNVRAVVQLILEHLKLEILAEITPDYTALELVARAALNDEVSK